MSDLKIMKIIFVFFLLLIAFSVEARMYQWLDPNVGITQLSGKPPPWYRSDAGGPRVFVFDNGRLIDDTALKVSADIGQQMRQAAFLLVEQERRQAQEQIAKAKEMKREQNKKKSDNTKKIKELDNTHEKKPTIEQIVKTLFPKKQEQKEDAISDKSLDELRAIISAWEAAQTENAKQVLE